MDNIRKYFGQNRNGATTFEWSLLAPFTFVLCFFCLFFMIMLFSWASFNSLAGEIAQDINYRQTGFKYIASNTEPIKASVITNRGNSITQHELVTIKDDQVVGTVGNNKSGNVPNAKVRQALIVAMNKIVDENTAKHKSNQFMFPFTNFKKISCNIARPDGSAPSLNEASTGFSARNFSSSIVTVEIEYQFMPIYFGSFTIGGTHTDFTWPGITMHSTGYGVIT